ncbi:MAG: glycosyltransferase family 4 protein [Flavipsychrobacter sp.]
MNILIIDNSLNFTGAFKCALNEADLLSDQHKFTFILHSNSNLKKPLQEKGYKVHQLHMVEIKRSIPVLFLYPLMLLRNAVEVFRIVANENIDVVQVNDYYNLIGVMLKKLGYKGKLITYVRFLPSAIPGILNKWWTKLAQKYSYKVIAVSDAVLQQLPQKENTIRIYDPVKLEEQLPEDNDEETNTIDLLYLGNYIKGKGQDYAIEAFAMAYEQNQLLRLRFAGGIMGLDKNAAFKVELQKRAQELGIAEVVTFDSFSTNIEQDIKEADIVLNFSDAESFSMTCLEAAFYGTPLIATKCGGPEEIIVHEETGLLVPKADTTAMSDAILTLANNRLVRDDYALAGKAYVRNKFSISNYTTAIESILKEEQHVGS